MAKMAMLYKNGYLSPADSESMELYEHFREGRVYQFSTKEAPRSWRFHKKFFAMLKLVLDMQEKYDNVNDLRVEVLLRGGFYSEHLTVKGGIVYVPESMKFDSMSVKRFEEVYNKSIDVCIKYFCTGMTREEIMWKVDELIQFV